MMMRRSQSGNIFFALFGAVGLVGVLGAATMTIMKGPVRSMAEVTKRTIAENAMIAAGRLSLSAATRAANGGDCDGDNYIEPVEWSTTGTGIAPVGGGFIPATIGAAQQDPWGTTYGYCAWDHGATVDDAGCGGAAQKRLDGEESENYVAIAVISAGANRSFETSCNDTPDYLTRVSGSDDIILEYTYGESSAMGLWRLKTGDPDTAEIGARDIEIAGSGGAGAARIGYDADLDMAGVGDFLAIKTDSIYAKTPAGPVSMFAPLRAQNVESLDPPIGGAWDSLAGLSCAEGEILKWNDGVPGWECAEDGGGGGGGEGGEVDDFNSMIVAFEAASCPSGWSEYMPARGRFLRGIDNGAGNDPDGTRTAGDTQDDEFKSHKHDLVTSALSSSAGPYGYLQWGSGVNSSGDYTDAFEGSTGGDETRPKNVAVIFCSYDGPLTIPGGGGGSGEGGWGPTQTGLLKNTEYTAPSDGLVTANALRGSAGTCQFAGDVNGVRIGTDGSTYTTGNSGFVAFPVREGDVWEIVENTSCDTYRITFTPLTGGGSLGDEGCDSGEILKWDGDSWECAADGGGGEPGTEVAFSVHKNGTNQTVPASTYTKLTWSTERFDTNNNFASDRFTPTVAGKYIITLSVYCTDSVDSWCIAAIAKNDSYVSMDGPRAGNSGISSVSVIVDMNGSSDYVEAYAYNGGGTTISGGHNYVQFSGALIGGGGGGSDTLSGLSCDSGQVAQWNGSAWACANENAAAGQEVAFRVHKNGTNQTVPADTWTNLTWSAEDFDTNDNFAADRFTPTVAGKYYLTAAAYCDDSTSFCGVILRKNGSSMEAYNWERGSAAQIRTSTIVDMNGTTDYIEAEVINNAGTTIRGHAAYTYFTGALIGGGAAVPMMAGWPDAIMCLRSGENSSWLYKLIYWDDSTVYYRYSTGTGTAYDVYFDPDDKTYQGYSGDGTSDCVTNTMSIADLYADGRAFNFGGGAAGDSVWDLSGSDAYYNDGSVGIGTSSPQDKLHVAGSTNGANVALRLTSPDDGGTDRNGWVEFDPDANLVYFMNGSAKAGLNSSGHFGIGLLTPDTPLHVYSGTAGMARLQDSSASGDSAQARIEFYGANSSRTGYVGDASTGNGHLYLLSDGGDVRADGSGGTCYINTGGCASDIRLKQDIQPVEGALDKLVNLSGVIFEWKKNPGEHYMGFIAQEVEKQFPILVKTDEEGIKSVNYNGIAAPIVEAIKEFKALFDELVEKLARIIERLDGHDTAIAELMEQVRQLKADNDNLRRETADLRADNDNLREDLRALEPTLATEAR